ncbi:unnamed protein product [Closterium sp. Naga37s-1]|nr:unnamed protein product [Closterium sp. Naga37s-1]
MNGNGSSRGHVITHGTGSTTDVVSHGNGSSSHIVMRGHGSTGHRRQLQLVGHVKAFEAELQYYVPVPIRTHRERANLLVEPLGFDFNSSNQQRVLLHYLEHDPKWGTLAQCRGDTCPSMASCGPRFPNLQACLIPNLVEPEIYWPEPPVNCPKRIERRLKEEGVEGEKEGRGVGGGEGEEGGKRRRLGGGEGGGEGGGGGDGGEGWTSKHVYDGYDESCSQKQDFSPHYPSAPQLMQLQHVYVTAKGSVFNRTHNFVRPGCGRFNEISYSAQQQVHVLPAAFSWAYSQGFNFYHFIVETMPLFLVAAPLLPRILPSIPILAEDMQWDAYKRFGEVLIGVKYGAMRSLPLVKADLFLVHTLYEVRLWQSLHAALAIPQANPPAAPTGVASLLNARTHLLHPLGLPLFLTRLWQSLHAALAIPQANPPAAPTGVASLLNARTHLLHPRGLPLFRPDWSYQPPQPLSPQQAQALPPDWVVVLAKRLSKKRSISNFKEVQAVVERAFPKERIVLFTGSLTVLEGTIVSFVMILSLGNALFFKAVQAVVQRAFPKERIVLFTGSLTVLEAHNLFRRTRLFIAGHGAALTNLVFMPSLLVQYTLTLCHFPPASFPFSARNLFRRARLFIAGHGAALTNLVFMPERASLVFNYVGLRTVRRG